MNTTTEPPGAVGVEQYVYVDTAFGGPHRRNIIQKLADVRPNGSADCFASHNRGTEELPRWVETHRNKNGNPTVEGFDGPTWAPDLHLDFDHEPNPAVALRWLRQVLDKLDAAGADLTAVRISFSGSKGFHLEIPHTLFGGFVPSKEFPRRLQRAAKRILRDIPFDTSVYDTLRLWRIANTKHGTTGLFKIPLTVDEARSLTLDQIKELAQAPRDIPAGDDAWQPVEALVDIWDATIADDEPTEHAEPRAPTNEARDRQTIAAISASWPYDGENMTEGEGPDVHVSRHTNYLMPAIGFLVRHTSAEHACELVVAAAEQAGDGTFLARDWRSEIERIAEGAEQRVSGASEGGVYGLPTLREKFPQLAAVLGAIWVPAGPHVRIRASADAVLDEAPAFPLDALPDAFRRYSDEVAEALPCPSDYVASPLLAAAGAAIGNALELQAKSSWVEGANLYTAVVGEPGSKKTPAINKGIATLMALQKRLTREYTDDVGRFEDALEAWQASDRSMRGPRPRPPVYRHVVSTDTTTEALAPMLRDSKGILLCMDELSGWVRSMDQYRSGGKGADRQHFLKWWSRTPDKVDRKGSPVPILVPRPCLSVTGGIQSDLLPLLASEAQRNDGFPDRLLWAWPDSVPDRLTDAEVSTEAVEAVQRIFDDLFNLQPGVDTDGDPKPRPVQLGPEAASIWQAWYTEHTAERESDDFPAYLQGPWAKMPGQLLRLALILHAVDGGTSATAVSGETFAAACELIRYFKGHARRVYRRLMHDRGKQDMALTILAALKERGPMAQSAIYIDVFNRNVSADRLRTAFESLEEAGLASRERRQGTAGRPPVIWTAT